MAAGNLSAGLMDPKTRALYANLLRRPNVTITQNTASAQRPSNIEGMRIQDQQRQMAQTRDALNTVDPGFGYYAPLAGVIKGIASNISRGQQEKSLDELYGQYAAAQQAERAQAAQAAEAARLQKLEDEKAMAAFKANLPPSAQEQLALDETRLTMLAMRQKMAQEQAKADRAEEEYQAGLQEAENVAAKKRGVQDDILGDINYLLSPENRNSFEAATGSVQGLIPSVSQGTVDWENRFSGLVSKLTSENLDMMTGVLSESDIKILGEIASGGINLRSSPEAIESRLQTIQTKLDNARQGQPSAGVLKSDQADTIAVGTVARNPKTGEELVWNGNEWSPK